MHARIRLLLPLVLVFYVIHPEAEAREFRDLKPIPTPGAAPEGVTAVAGQALDPQAARSAAEQVFKDWNTAGIGKYLADDFYDKSRLTDAMSEKVPRDARVRIMSIRGVQTLEQFQRGNEVISTVSVTADTQVEFNDVTQGFRRLDGTNEYVFRITEEVME